MAKFNASFDGVMDRLEELEQENHRLRDAALKIAEAIAKADGRDEFGTCIYCDACDVCDHLPTCIVAQARMVVAQGEGITR